MFLASLLTLFFSQPVHADFFSSFKIDFTDMAEYDRVCPEHSDACLNDAGHGQLTPIKFHNQTGEFHFRAQAGDYSCEVSSCAYDRLTEITLSFDSTSLPDFAYGEDSYEVKGYFTAKWPSNEQTHSMECHIVPFGFVQRLEHGTQVYCYYLTQEKYHRLRIVFMPKNTY